MAAFTQRPGGDRPVPTVRVGSLFGGGPSKLGVRPTAPTQTTQIVPGTLTRTQQQPSSSFAPHPQTGVTPTQLGPAPGANTAPGQSSSSTPGPSPLDSTYYANVNQHNFQVGNQVNGLVKQQGFDDTALQTALGNLAYQQPRDALNLEEAAGRRGALYSTVYDQQAGDLAHQYLTKENAAQTAHDNTQALRLAQIKGLMEGIPLYAQGQAAAAAVRAANQNAANKALGEPAPPTWQKLNFTTVTPPKTPPKVGKIHTSKSLPKTRSNVNALAAAIAAGGFK